MAKMENTFNWNAKPAGPGGGAPFDPTPLWNEINALKAKLKTAEQTIQQQQTTIQQQATKIQNLETNAALKNQSNTFTQNNTFNNPLIVATPTNPNQATTKKYVDDAIANIQPAPPGPQPPNPLLEQRIQALENWKTTAEQTLTDQTNKIQALENWQTTAEPQLTDLNTNAARVNQANIFTEPQRIDSNSTQPALTVKAVGNQPAYIAFAKDNDLLGHVGKSSWNNNFISFSGTANALAKLLKIAKGVNADDGVILENIQDAQQNLNGASEAFVLQQINDLKNGTNNWTGQNTFHGDTSIDSYGGKFKIFDSTTGGPVVQMHAYDGRGVLEIWSFKNNGSVYVNGNQFQRTQPTLPSP